MSVPPRLLEVENLRTFFHTDGAVAGAVDGVSFTVGAGETLAIVRESGSGKSVTSLSIMRLIPTTPGRSPVASYGSVAMTCCCYRGGGRDRHDFPGPMSSLNPLLTVVEQIAEVVRLHQGLGRSGAWRRAVEMLARVSVPDQRAGKLPAQTVGRHAETGDDRDGSGLPSGVVIADEPTTALDVTIQEQILQLVRTLPAEMGTNCSSRIIWA